MTEHWHAQVTFCFSILVVLFAAVVFYSEENVEVPHDEVSQNLPPHSPAVSSAGLLLAGALLHVRPRARRLERLHSMRKHAARARDILSCLTLKKT